MERTFAGPARAGPEPAADRAPTIVHSVLATRGEPLPAAVREDMRGRLGFDFSAVRVHADEHAAASAAAVFARAYVVGSHVVLGRGAQLDDRELLEHELTHVARAGPLPLPVPTDLQVAGVNEDRADRTAWSASRQAASPAPYLLRRQVAQATDKDRRDYVEATVTFLRSAADYYADPAVKVNAAVVSHALDGWYRAVTVQGRMADQLGDRAVSENLRVAYSHAVAVLLGKAAAQTHVELAELYRVNRGRIPIWAWQEPQHLLPGISTPVPVGTEADVHTHAVRVPGPGIPVSILPDATDQTLGNRARTHVTVQRTVGFQAQPRAGHQVVTRLAPAPTLSVTIQTFYGPATKPSSRSGYGRGTTPEDLAGAAVDPWSGTVGFHEGQHGMDYIQFFRTNPPPVFGGSVGMTVDKFRAAVQDWIAAVRAYEARAEAFTVARTHCVGVTIDQWENQHGGGRTTALSCPPPPHH